MTTKPPEEMTNEELVESIASWEQQDLEIVQICQRALAADVDL